MGLTRDTAPDGRPVELADVKAYLRLEATDTDSDEVLLGLLDAAVAHLDGAGGVLGRCLVQQTWDWTLDGWWGGPRGGIVPLQLPLAPVQSVTSITYVDGNGATQTWSSSLWQLATARVVAVLQPAYGQTWPSVRAQLDAITVRFVAGYAAEAGKVPGHNVPAPIKRAIVWLVAHWFENREPVAVGGGAVAELPHHVNALLAPYKVWSF